MTEISDEEAAEVLWASSEQGQAAVRAGWAKLLQLRGGNPVSLGIADVSAIVYAARLAAGGGAGNPPDRGFIRARIDEGIEAWRDGETFNAPRFHPFADEYPPDWMYDPETLKDFARVIAWHLVPATEQEGDAGPQVKAPWRSV